MMRLVVNNTTTVSNENVAGTVCPATLDSERDPANPNRRILYPLSGAEYSAAGSNTQSGHVPPKTV